MTRPVFEAESTQPRLIILAPVGPTSAHHLCKLATLVREQGQPTEYWCWARGDAANVPHQFAKVRVLSQMVVSGRWSLLAGYVYWMWRAFWAVAWSRKTDAFLCERFESAFPAVLASMLRPRQLMFYNSDNISMSYKWPRPVRWCFLKLEAFAARRCALHVVPAASRWHTHDANLRLAQNWPSRPLAEDAVRIARERGNSRPASLTVFVNGWLPETRGMRMTLAAAERLRDVPVKFVVCGYSFEASASKLIQLPNVEHLPEMPANESLATYYRCHVVLAFYDPSIEINRLAEPNKWFDCIVTNTPFITNIEVKTAAPYLNSGACFAVPYNNDAALELLLRNLAADPSLLGTARENLSRIPREFWDEQMAAVLNEFLAPLRKHSLPEQRSQAA